MDLEHDERPWGIYTVLDDGPGHKVKADRGPSRTAA